MDYEKKYKDALEWAKKVMQGKVGFVLDDVLEKFPELKESENEDERIRKWLIEMVEEVRKANPTNESHNGNCSDAIAWLEKQGEQKPVKFKPLFRVGDVIKPKDPVLGEPRIIKGIHQKFGYDTNNGILDFEFEDNWELVEQKPAWSEEDEKISKAIIKRINGESDYLNVDLSSAICWIKNVKDRVQQQQWKPNEQDILLLERIFDGTLHPKDFQASLQNIIEQLKKLKD